MNSHERFASRYQLDLPLLVDADSSVAKAYGALRDDSKIQRTVVIVDKGGVVRYYQRGMPAAEDLLAVIKGLAMKGAGA